MNNDPIGTTSAFLFYEFLLLEIYEPAVLMNEAASDRDLNERHHADFTTLGNIRGCCATF